MSIPFLGWAPVTTTRRRASYAGVYPTTTQHNNFFPLFQKVVVRRTWADLIYCCSVLHHKADAVHTALNNIEAKGGVPSHQSWKDYVCGIRSTDCNKILNYLQEHEEDFNKLHFDYFLESWLVGTSSMEVPANHTDPEDEENMQPAPFKGNSRRRSPRIAAKNASASSSPTSDPKDNPASRIQPQHLNPNEEYPDHSDAESRRVLHHPPES